MGELLGHQWQPREIAKFAYDAGWKDARLLVRAVCVCLAESQGYDRAINVNPDGSRDRGIWQLNDIHGNITDAIAYDPARASIAAFGLFRARGGFDDWAAWTHGVYLHDSYVGRAAVGVANFLGEWLLGFPVPDKLDGTPYKHGFTTPIANFQHRLVGCLDHANKAGAALGWDSAGRTKVAVAQKELAKARTAAKDALPQ